MRPEASLVLWLAVAPLAAEEAAVADIEEEELERTPLHTVVPAYPESALRDRIEGEVQVCFHIDAGGKPYRVAVRKSTHRVFERPSLIAVKSSAYVPLEPDEKATSIKSCRTFRFNLESVPVD